VLPLGDVSAVELNSYGLLFYKTVLADEQHFINPQKFYADMAVYFKTAANFYREIGVISPLLLIVKLSNARGSKIKTAAGEKLLIEDYIRIDKNILPSDMQRDLPSFILPVMEEFAWAIDLPFTNREEAAALINAALESCR